MTRGIQTTRRFAPSSTDVWAAHLPAKSVAERADATAALRARVREIAARHRDGKNRVAEVLRRELHDAVAGA